MPTRENEPPMPPPLAYFINGSTYGTWLPGDERGWAEYRHGWHLPDSARKLEAAAKMTEDACLLDQEQRKAVHEQVAETCLHRGWTLHAVNCRTNHMHLVVSAPLAPEKVRSQLKAWCTRKLKNLAWSKGQPGPVRENWWAERGSQRYINDEVGLETATIYVRDGQD
jgi:REP element-mobilizing transposase RayT